MRRFRRCRCCHGVENDRRFLALELVYGTDARAGQPLLQFEDLGVVGSDYENVVQSEWALVASPVDPACRFIEQMLYQRRYRFRLLRRRTLVAVVFDGNEAQSATLDRAVRDDALILKTGTRLKSACNASALGSSQGGLETRALH